MKNSIKSNLPLFLLFFVLIVGLIVTPYLTEAQITTGIICEVYDDFSGANLDLTKWEETMNRTELWDSPIYTFDEHYLDTINQNYHTQNFELDHDKGIELKMLRELQAGDTLEYDLIYSKTNPVHAGETNHWACALLDDTSTLFGNSWYIGKNKHYKEYGTYHFIISYYSDKIEADLILPNGSIEEHSFNTISAPSTFSVISRTAVGVGGSFAHFDYDNFKICREGIINYGPEIVSYTPTEETLSIFEKEPIEFTHISTDQDNDALTYSWKLDNTEVSTEQNWVYALPNRGNHVVELTVSDGALEVSQSWSIKVYQIVQSELKCNLYDNFSEDSLNLSRWSEIQDPEGQPLTEFHFVDTDLDNYHVQNYDSVDKRTILNLIGKTLQPGEVLKYNVNYISGEGNRAIVIFLNGEAVDRQLSSKLGCQWCGSIGFNGQAFDVGNEFGLYNLTLEFVSNGMKISVIRPDETIYDKFLPSTPPFNVGFETWSNGKIHVDYDDFEFCYINYAPEIESFSPIETNLTINETNSIEFIHNSIDFNNDNLNYKWKLDDVEQSTEQNWIFTTDYESVGEYNVTLTVSDGSLESKMVWNITVNNLPEPEPVSVSSGGSGGGGGGGGSGGGGRRITEEVVQEKAVIEPTAPSEALENLLEMEAKPEEEPEIKENIVSRAFKGVGHGVKRVSKSIGETFKGVGRGITSVFKGIGRFFKWVF